MASRNLKSNNVRVSGKCFTRSSNGSLWCFKSKASVQRLSIMIKAPREIEQNHISVYLEDGSLLLKLGGGAKRKFFGNKYHKVLAMVNGKQTLGWIDAGSLGYLKPAYETSK